MPETLVAYLSDKASEYRIMAAPLNRAMREMEFEHQLIRARIENDISERVPAMSALADILNVSILDLLMAPDRFEFVRRAMEEANLTSDAVLTQLRSLGPPPENDELDAFGLGD